MAAEWTQIDLAAGRLGEDPAAEGVDPFVVGFCQEAPLGRAEAPERPGHRREREPYSTYSGGGIAAIGFEPVRRARHVSRLPADRLRREHARGHGRLNASAVDPIAGPVARVRRWFESGLIADLDRLTGDEADALAMWSISDARELAWDQAETLWKLRDHPDIAVPYEDALSRLVELGGRGILL